jgi:hypothetical protein
VRAVTDTGDKRPTWTNWRDYNPRHAISPDTVPAAALCCAAHQWAGGQRLDWRMSNADVDGRRQWQCHVSADARLQSHAIAVVRESQKRFL